MSYGIEVEHESEGKGESRNHISMGLHSMDIIGSLFVGKIGDGLSCGFGDFCSWELTNYLVPYDLGEEGST